MDTALGLFLRHSCQEGNFILALTRCEAYLTVANASVTFWKGASYSSELSNFVPQELIKSLISDMFSLANV